MSNSLFTLSLITKRDLLRARQMVRHAADLLGFESGDQLCLAAAVFDLACQAHAPAGRASVCCAIFDGCLHVVCTPMVKTGKGGGTTTPPCYEVSKRLPVAAAVPRDDVPWMLQQLAELAPLDLFEEMKKINQELLQTLLEVARQRQVQDKQGEPSAA